MAQIVQFNISLLLKNHILIKINKICQFFFCTSNIIKKKKKKKKKKTLFSIHNSFLNVINTILPINIYKYVYIFFELY